MFAVLSRSATVRSCALSHPCIHRPSLVTVYRGFAVKVGSTRYTKSHEYIQLTGEKTATVGISEHAAKELGDVVYVDLPDVNGSFSQSDPFGSVESVKAASSVYAPVDLTVKQVNDKLKDESGLINQGAEKEGWMIKVEVKDAKQLEQLMDAAAYKKHCQESQH